MKRTILICVLVITLAFTLLATKNSQDSIVILSMMEQERNDALVEQLNKKFPDKHIIVTYMPTGKAAAKVISEGVNSEIDILLGMEAGYLSKLTDYLGDVSGISRIPYLKEFTPEANGNKWITWEKFAGSILINRKVLEKHGLEVPGSYEDLLDPQYQGMVAMPDPKSSGTGYFFYKSWVNDMGQEKALEFVDALYPNMKQFTESGSGPTKMLKQGEIAVGLGMTFQAMNEINAGQPLEIIFPKSGSPYSLTGASMLKGRENDPDIRELFSFLANDFFIYDKENFSPETIYEDQINRIPNYPQNIPYSDMTGIQDDREKERLLALWKY